MRAWCLVPLGLAREGNALPNTPDREPRLLDGVRAQIRLRHYSIRTEEAYVDWIRRFILFHGKRHPLEMGESEIGAFLAHLAVDRNVARSTQNQVLNAIVFLHRAVLHKKIEDLGPLVWAKKARHLPVVLTRVEVQAVLARLEGVHRLAAELMYGAGLRVLECVRLRIKEIEFARSEIMVRDGKGQRDRVTLLPERTKQPLSAQIAFARAIQASDLQAGFSSVHLPTALARKYRGADRDWRRQYVFPSERRSRDPAVGSCDVTTSAIRRCSVR
jgi:integron integrase